MTKIKSLLLSGIFLVALVGAVPVMAAQPEPSVIHVTGYAERELIPDTAYVTMTMETTAVEAETARMSNHQVMNSLAAKLKAIGIPSSDMKTLNYSLRPLYDQTNKKILRYRVNNSLRIKVSNLELLSRVLAQGADSGVNRISNVEFTCSNISQVKADLISAAVANGRLVAKSAAVAAGGVLGKVKEINVNGHFPVFNTRMLDGAMLMKAAGTESEAAPQLEAGTQKVSETVNMTFYIEE